MAAGTAAVLLTIAKWAAGVGATVVATDMLDRYYQENKGKIGKNWDKWIDDLKEKWQENYDKRGQEIAEQLKTEAITDRTDKEQTNGLQGSYDYTEFLNWLKSDEGQRFLNETAPRLRAEGLTGNISINSPKQEQIDSIQGNYDAGTYEEHYNNTLNAIKKLENNPAFDFTEDETIGSMLPNQGEENYDEEKTPIDTPTNKPTQDIEDKTDENLGTKTISWIEWAEQEQAKRWARDDAIMYATWEREDTAWQRGVEDMRKAGINPNLVGAQPAASGGGITQSSGQNLEGLTSQMYIDADKMQQLIDQNFKGTEAEKERFTELFETILNVAGMIVAFKKGKK